MDSGFTLDLMLLEGLKVTGGVFQELTCWGPRPQPENKVTGKRREPHFGQDMCLDKIMKGLCSYLVFRLVWPKCHILRWFLSGGRTHRPAVVKGSSFSIDISRIFENTTVIQVNLIFLSLS